MIRSNILTLLEQLEQKNNRKYSLVFIGQYINRSRQNTWLLFKGKQARNGCLRYETMAGLLHFFRSEGLDIGPGDLYIEIVDETTTLNPIMDTENGTGTPADKE
jgi:hypothetical protein